MENDEELFLPRLTVHNPVSQMQVDGFETTPPIDTV
jgi:hypothetical protein